MSGTDHTNASFTTRTPTTTCRSGKLDSRTTAGHTKGLRLCMLQALSLSLSFSPLQCKCVSVLLLICRESLCSRNAGNPNMCSSASEDLTSAYTGSADICNSDYACNSEDIQVSTNSEKDDDPDPDSAELLSNCDHESSKPRPAGPASQTATCQGQTPIEESSKKRRLRMMDEDSDGVRVKIIPCVKQQFRRRVEATRVLNDDFYVPNRAQLMLNFLQKHGDRIVQETPGPRRRFPNTLQLVQHVLQKSSGHRQ